MSNTNTTSIRLLQACRLPTLMAGLGPVIVGNTLGIKHSAHGEHLLVSPTIVTASIFFVILLQAAANLINDAKDGISGVDSAQRLGPVRFTSSGLLSVPTVVMTYRILLGLALGISLGFFFYAGLPVLIMGLACAVGAYAYTGGPFPLSHYGLGELVAFIFFGPVAVAGCYYLHTLEFSWVAIYWGTGPGMIAAAMMAVNNCRDRQTDAHAGKTTLAVLLGSSWSRRLPILFLVGSLVVLASSRWQGSLWIYGVLMGLILGVYVFNVIHPLVSGSNQEQNYGLKKISQFSFGYSVLLSLALWN